MNKDVVIKVENLSKKYQIGKQDSYLTLRDQLMRLPEKLFSNKKNEEFWALKDINFEVKRGEVIGIIGRNGAGKSTLLKILSRIVEPTSGKITMKGRVASLLEVGTGFNPELTGRENIYLNGAILGMSKKEIQGKFKEIVEFSGVEKFLDTPVKRYSSGMYVRLAFAVAAYLDADILLVDEVLAVGDAEFQKKCLGKMNDMAKSGKTVVFVSHDMGAVTTLCEKTIFLKEGNILQIGKTSLVVAKYLNNTSFNESEFFGTLAKKVSINKVKINGLTNGVTINPSEELKIKVFGKVKEKIENIRITLSIYNQDCRIFSIQDTSKPETIKKGEFVSEFIIKENLLRPDDYYIYIGGYQDDSKDWFYGERLSKFKIIPKWSNKNKKINIGIINILSENKRTQ